MAVSLLAQSSASRGRRHKRGVFRIRIAAMRRATDPGRPGSGIVVIISGESAVSTRILALFNLRDGTTPAAYEQWARTTDLPVVNALPSIERFEETAKTAKRESMTPATPGLRRGPKAKHLPSGA
jgi:hypothetical protein